MFVDIHTYICIRILAPLDYRTSFCMILTNLFDLIYIHQYFQTSPFIYLTTHSILFKYILDLIHKHSSNRPIPMSPSTLSLYIYFATYSHSSALSSRKSSMWYDDITQSTKSALKVIPLFNLIST